MAYVQVIGIFRGLASVHGKRSVIYNGRCELNGKDYGAKMLDSGSQQFEVEDNNARAFVLSVTNIRRYHVAILINN